MENATQTRVPEGQPVATGSIHGSSNSVSMGGFLPAGVPLANSSPDAAYNGAGSSNAILPTTSSVAPPAYVAVAPSVAPAALAHVPPPPTTVGPPPATGNGYAPEPALNVSLQSARLMPMYTALPSRARVTRAQMMGFGKDRDLLPKGLPYDADYAFSLCTDNLAVNRLNAALNFDSWGSVINLNHNGNLPVTNAWDGLLVSVAGRTVPACFVTTGFSWTSDLKGYDSGRGYPSKSLHVRQLAQEYELFQGALGSLHKRNIFHVHCDLSNGAAMFQTKNKSTASDESTTGGAPTKLVEDSTGAGKTLAPMTFGGDNPATTSIFTKTVLQYTDEVPVFDGRSGPFSGGFMFTPQDWTSIDSLPRLPSDKELPVNTLVTVGFSTSSYKPFQAMRYWGTRSGACYSPHVSYAETTLQSLLDAPSNPVIDVLDVKLDPPPFTETVDSRSNRTLAEHTSRGDPSASPSVCFDPTELAASCTMEVPAHHKKRKRKRGATSKGECSADSQHGGRSKNPRNDSPPRQTDDGKQAQQRSHIQRRVKRKQNKPGIFTSSVDALRQLANRLIGRHVATAGQAQDGISGKRNTVSTSRLEHLATSTAYTGNPRRSLPAR
ncbi:hypothetical protein PM082_021678 [Marasmius tenuissimus]|nr:hypothetical protein PM082_021678 [Marasmius tenuissimus]